MVERGRKVFIQVCLARETGDPEAAPVKDLFPDVAASLQDELRKRKAEGRSMEFRNLCVRKVELVLVRNFSDNRKDEFTVRISAHAQRIVRRGTDVVSQQEYVSPFEEYWTFGRLDGEWKLKEVLPSARGEQMIGQENLDEDSSWAQVDWYYRQTRAV
jgi:hypothetical protein